MNFSLSFLLVPSHSPLVLCACLFVSGSLLVWLYSFVLCSFRSLPFSAGTLCLPVCLWKFVSLTMFDYIYSFCEFEFVFSFGSLPFSSGTLCLFDYIVSVSLSLSFLLVLPFSSGTVVCFLLMRKTRNKSRHIFAEFPAMQNCRTPSFCLSTVSLWAVLFFSLSAPSLSRSPVHQSSFGDVHSNNINVCSVRMQSMTCSSYELYVYT